jgi:phosphatidate cytidylyltransferase
MFNAMRALFMAARLFTLSAAAQIADAPRSALVGTGVLPISTAHSTLLLGGGVDSGVGTLTLPDLALSPASPSPLHSAASPAAALAVRADRPAASSVQPVRSALSDSPLTAPMTTLVPAGEARNAVPETGRAALEAARPAVRIASAEDRVLRSVFGDRREAELAVPAAPLSFERPSLSAASSVAEAVPTEPAPPAPVPAGKDSPFLRIATGIGLVAVQAAMIHWGMRPFAVFMAAVSGIMMYEYDVMMSRSGHLVQRAIAIIAGASLAYTVSQGLSMAALPILAGVVLFRELFEKERSYDRVALTLTGALLLGWLPGHVSLIRETNPHGQAMTFMYFAAVWATDTFAYIVGKTLGRHKLAPVLSPKKTWEGAVGGFLAALGTTFTFAHFMPDLLSLKAAAIIGAAIGVLGQLSGFSASMIKRWAGVKDSGKLLPGHGGFLDRFDSVLFSAPLVYWLLKIFH